MKTRTGFVSNSSSSSFVIQKENLSPAQIKLIHNHIHRGEKLGVGEYYGARNEWAIRETDTTVEGSTIMDNFDMYCYLTEVVKVDTEHVQEHDHDAAWADPEDYQL